MYNNIYKSNQPKDFKINLFDHQLASIYNMEKLEREKIIEKDDYIQETRLGINADPTGFGKTLSMIGLIVRDKMIWDMNIPFIIEKIESVSLNIIVKRKINRYKKLPCTLILISSSILKQWEEDLKYTNLNFISITKRKDIDNIEIENCDVVLVIPSMYNNLIKSYSKYSWKRFIFDEPGHVRVPSMKENISGFYWFVTATPNSISYLHRNCRNSFIRNILGDNHWIDFESQFNNIILKNNIDFIKKSFSMPKIYNNFYKCYQPILKAIDGIADENIKNLLEADNIEDIISLLGGKKTENIIELVKNKKLLELEQIKIKIDIYKTKEDNSNNFLNNWINKQNHILYQINELDNRFNKMLNGICCICLEKLYKPVLEPNCQNLFCGKCLLKNLSINKNCPLCRSIIDIKDIIYLKSNDNESTSNDKIQNIVLTKLQQIIKIITEIIKEKKFLIFSNYENTFKPICKVLKENKINYSLVKGTVNKRENIIKEYKNGGTKVIFLNSIFNGAGINLQETTDIIFYHKISKSMKEQIIGRAQRIGAKNILNIHYLDVEI